MTNFVTSCSSWRGSFHMKVTRTLPTRMEDPWYDADHQVRRVRPSGTIKWKGEEVFIGEALVGELIGLAERDNGCAMARFCGRDLGVIDRDCRFLRFAPLVRGSASLRKRQ